MSNTIKSINPYNGELLKEFDIMSADEINQKIDKADEAFKKWRNTPVEERAKIMRKVAELMREKKVELGKYATLEMGKRKNDAINEVVLSASFFDYYADKAAEFLADQPYEGIEGAEAVMTHEPIGTILSVQPWNFPYYQLARSIAPNLMAGNTMIMKHASIVPQCAKAMEDVLNEAGLPEGVYYNIFIPGSKIEQFVSNDKIKGVSLTGSEPAGASIAQAAGKNIKKSLLELGGSDPFIVMEDANLEEALQMVLNGRMWNAGQVCASPKRWIVPASMYDQFVEETKKALGGLKLGDPMDESTDVAPLSSESAAVQVVEQIEEAEKQGATIVVGGKRGDQKGAFVQPTLITGITKEMDAFYEEIFGPVVMIYSYNTIEEAIELANATRFGLTGNVFGKDIKKAQEVARKLEVGAAYVNHFTTVQPELPFGGTKASGYGREHGKEGFYEFVNKKMIKTTK